MVTAPRAVGTEGLVRLGVGAFAVVLRLGQVRSVERGDRVRGGDGAPLTITVRGGEFPVFSLADLLHAPDATPPGTGQVVLTEVAGDTVGVWAAKVAPVPRTDAATITPFRRELGLRLPVPRDRIETLRTLMLRHCRSAV